MLKVQNINVYYGRIHALKDLSIDIDQGKIVTIVGANGAGKSTLMWTLAGVLKAKSGTMTFMGKPYLPMHMKLRLKALSWCLNVADFTLI